MSTFHILSSTVFLMNGVFAAQFGDYTYTENPTSVEITQYNGDERGHLVIPGTIDGKPVTQIGDGAFGLSNFSGMTIPSSVLEIKQLAFQGCTSLLEVIIPGTVERIGDSAFFENYELKSIIFEDSDIQLGSSIFVRCGIGETGNSREEMVVTLGQGMTNLGGGMFANCRNIRTVAIPDTLTTVGNGVFQGCARMHTVSLGGVTTISNGCFESCSALSSINLEGVESIGEEAFQGCSSLTEVLIPDTVHTIRKQAFQSCSNLASIVFEGGIPTVFENAELDDFLFALNAIFPVDFSGTGEGATVYYTDDSIGFTTPTWEGFPSVFLPPAAWLVENNLPLATDLSSVPTGAEDSYLKSYAFDLALDGKVNSSEVALVSHSPASFSYKFKGGSPGVQYIARRSSDLSVWVTEGVTLSAPDSAGIRTCTVTTEGKTKDFLQVEAIQSW